MQHSATGAATEDGKRRRKLAPYGYTLAILTILNAFNFLDRQIITILAEPIKAEFQLADWQIGMMTGFSFAVLYCIAGFPLARWAERGDRVWILSFAVLVWSGFTAACGLAQNLLQFLLARVGVGIGEAGCTPTAHSLLSDIAPAEKRGSALSIYTMGAPLGSLAGLAFGGVVASFWGWRMALVLASLPGIFLAAIAFFTLVEPRRLQSAIASSFSSAPPFREAVTGLLRNTAYMRLTIANAVSSMVLYGSSAFFGSFYLRNHVAELSALAPSIGQKPIGFLGIALGATAGLGGIIGAIMGGGIADRWAARDSAAFAYLPAIGVLLSSIAMLAAMLLPTVSASIMCIGISYACVTGGIGVQYAASLALVPSNSRATASALTLFVVNMVGLGLGPLLVGLLSDLFARHFGMTTGEGLRWAMIAVITVGFISAAIFASTRDLLRLGLQPSKQGGDPISDGSASSIDR